MSRPEETLDQLANLAREDEARLDELPAELAAPLSAEKKAAMVDVIQARLAASRGGQEPAPKVEPVRSAPIPLWRRPLAGAAAITALAAGLLLWVARPLDSTALLPAYDAQVEGSQQRYRSLEQRLDSLRLRPGSTLKFELRPKRDFKGAVRARVLLTGGVNLEPSEMVATQEQSAAGALRLEVLVPDTLPERGEVTVVVGRAGAPAANDAQRFRWSFERAP